MKCQSCDRQYLCPLSQDLRQMEGFLTYLPPARRSQTMDSILQRFTEPALCAMDAGYVPLPV